MPMLAQLMSDDKVLVQRPILMERSQPDDNGVVTLTSFNEVTFGPVVNMSKVTMVRLTTPDGQVVYTKALTPGTDDDTITWSVK